MTKTLVNLNVVFISSADKCDPIESATNGTKTAIGDAMPMISLAHTIRLKLVQT